MTSSPSFHMAAVAAPVQGELDVLDTDQATVLFRIPEGTIFGEPEVVRLLAGHNDSGNAHTESSATLDKVGYLARISSFASVRYVSGKR